MHARTPLRWSFSSLGAHEASLDELLALAAREGFPGVELRTIAGSVDLPAVFAAEPGGLAGVRARAEALGVRVSGLDTSYRLLGWKDEDWDGLAAWAVAGEALGAATLRVFDGGKPGEMPTAAELDAAARFLDRWRALRAARGWAVEVALETHDALVTADVRAALRERVGPLPLLWDTHHTWKKGGEDPLATLDEVLGETLAVHVKDSIPVPSARHPFTYVEPGAGEFPASPLLAAIAGRGFGGWVVFEWERQWHPYLAPLAAVLPSLARAGWRRGPA